MVVYGKTMGDLLSAYNENRDVFGDDFNIPESNNGIPDILDEIKPQLNWMSKMQNQENGGVYHKVSCASFPSVIMPDKENNEFIVCPISITATANFAAVMAMAYETFKDIDSDLANKYINAGERAWEYIERSPNKGGNGFVNPSGIHTGEYPDRFDDDDIYWAAAQLFKATGKDKYNEAFKELFKKYGMMPGYDLAKLGYYGTVAYINSDNGDEGIRTQLKNKMIKKAVPGMLVAGTNCIFGDAIAKNLFANEPAAKCYIDSREIYSVNEVDIYWNSALIYLMSKTVMK